MMDFIIQKIYAFVNRYDETVYWRLRAKVINPEDETPKLIKLWWLYRLKKMEAFNGASLGTYVNYGSVFAGSPSLPHGLRGIHISDKAQIGNNVTIFQQIVIGVAESGGGAPTVGDNCILGAGCKVIGDIHIGNNVKIGANCVVHFDVPDNATVVCEKARVILK